MPATGPARSGSTTTFVAERYWPGVSPASFEAAASRSDRSAKEMQREGRRIRYVRSTLVPADETLFCFFEAAELQDVVELNERAGLAFDRIVEAVMPESETAPSQ